MLHRLTASCCHSSDFRGTCRLQRAEVCWHAAEASLRHWWLGASRRIDSSFTCDKQAQASDSACRYASCGRSKPKTTRFRPDRRALAYYLHRTPQRVGILGFGMMKMPHRRHDSSNDAEFPRQKNRISGREGLSEN